MSGRNPPLIFQIAVDNSGTPVPGAALYHYVTNTTVPKAIFYDFELTTPCPQPLIADTEGRYPQYFLEDGQYTFVEYDAPLPDGVQLRPPAHHIEGVNGDAYTLPVATDDTLGGVKGGGDVTIDEDGTMHVDYGEIPGPDLALLDPDTLVVQQLTGVGAGLLPVVTDFSFPDNPGVFPPSQSGGRGIAAGRSYVGGVQVASWCAQANRGDLFWSFDYWTTSVQDQSLSTAFPSGMPNWNSLAYVYMARFSSYAWIAGDAENPVIYYALHEPASYNANGTIKVAAWNSITYPSGAPNQPADFASAGSVTCWVGNDVEVARTVDFLTFTSPLTLPSVPGGIATDSYGTWLVVCRDSGILYRSINDAATWSAYTSFFVDGVAAAALPTDNGEQWGAVLGAYGIWVITNVNPAPGSISYVWSEDGLHWTTYTGEFQAFYSAGFDGVRFYGTNIASGAATSIYQLLVSSIPAHRRLAMEKGAAISGPVFMADLPGATGIETDANGKMSDMELGNATDPAKGAAKVGYKGRDVAARLGDVPSVLDWEGDDTTRIQAALSWLSTNGGRMLIPPGIYTIEDTLEFSRSPLGCTVDADGVDFIYTQATGACLKFTNTGVSAQHHLPYVVLRGLNLKYVNAIAVSGNEGLVLENMLSSYFENVKVNAFGDNYVMRNIKDLPGGIWSENNRFIHCASRVPYRAHWRFTRSGTSSPLGSFSRTIIDQPFIDSRRNSALQGTIGFQIDPACALYDSVIRDISGNFSGDAMVWIRRDGALEGNMEGSTIDGLRWEDSGTNSVGTNGPVVAILLDSPDDVKLPNVYNRGNYCFGLGSSRMRIWGDNSGSTPGTTDNIVPILRPSTPQFLNFRNMSPVYTPEGSYAELGLTAHQAVFFGQTFEEMVQGTWYSLNEPTWGRPFNADHGIFAINVELMQADGESGIQGASQGFKGSYIISRAATQAGSAQITVLSETPRTEVIEFDWPQSTFSPAYRGVPQVRVTGGTENRGVRLTISAMGVW